MYELFKIVSVIAIILWALRDKIDEPRNVKYCCNKANETEVKVYTIESSLIEAPSDDDTPAAQPFIADETPVIDMPAAESTFDMPAAESIVELSIIDMPAAESTVEQSTVDMPAAESTVELSTNNMPAAESTVELSTNNMPTIDDDAPEEDILSIEDLYGDYTDLLMPSIMLRLSNNTSINNTFVQRNNCFGVVHASI